MSTPKFTITIRDCPKIIAAEAQACRFLIVCYIRGHQFAEEIRKIEPVHEQAMLTHDRALKDLEDEPGSVAHGPSPSDRVQRFEHLMRCRKIFDGPTQTLYECVIYLQKDFKSANLFNRLYRSFCAVKFAIQTITEIEFANCVDRDCWTNQAYNHW